MIQQLTRLLKFIIFSLLIITTLANRSLAQHENEEEVTSSETESAVHSDEPEFKPGEFIMDHIKDSYEWHIMTIGEKPDEKHITIPLPVIVFGTSEHNKGLHIFMSSAFHHGHDAHDGFRIATEGDLKGKIVEADDQGNYILTTDENGKTSMVKPWDFSITKNVLALFISLFLIVIIFLSVAKAYKKREGKSPKGLQSLIEPLIIFIRDDVAKASISEKKYEKFTPYLLTIFFFIFFNNLMGLIPLFPGGANLTGNIAITMVLAVFTFIITTFSGNRAYWKHVFWPPVPVWLKLPIPLMIIVEIIGVVTKPFVLMVRLFANITAGHIIALGFFSLIFIFGAKSDGGGYGFSVVSVIFTVFMTLLELLVAFIQAYVFTLLSALYFGMATEEHH